MAFARSLCFALTCSATLAGALSIGKVSRDTCATAQKATVKPAAFYLAGDSTTAAQSNSGGGMMLPAL